MANSSSDLIKHFGLNRKNSLDCARWIKQNYFNDQQKSLIENDLDVFSFVNDPKNRFPYSLHHLVGFYKEIKQTQKLIDKVSIKELEEHEPKGRYLGENLGVMPLAEVAKHTNLGSATSVSRATYSALDKIKTLNLSTRDDDELDKFYEDGIVTATVLYVKSMKNSPSPEHFIDKLKKHRFMLDEWTTEEEINWIKENFSMPGETLVSLIVKDFVSVENKLKSFQALYSEVIYG